jgi:molecular chaperone GrpE
MLRNLVRATATAASTSTSTSVARAAPITASYRAAAAVFRAYPSPSSFTTARFYSEEAAKTKKEETTGESDAAEPEAVDELTKAKQEVETAKKETAEFKDRYLRSVADFRNLQESTKREIKKSKELALKSFARDLLETADTFEIALKTLEQEDHSTTEKKVKELKDLIEGVQITQSMFLNTLKRHGLAQIEAVGEKFDPNVHEATFEVPQPDKEEGTVFFVQQPGYYLNGRVLRPAKVGVVKGAE